VRESERNLCRDRGSERSGAYREQSWKLLLSSRESGGREENLRGTLTIYRKIGNQSRLAGAMNNIASVLGDMRKLEDAKKLSQGALKIYREIADYTGEGETLVTSRRNT
jgi:hypothetical protein